MVKRRNVILGMAALPVMLLGATRFAFSQSSTLEGDTVPTASGDITIHPIDHASLVLGYGDQAIYVDPVVAALPGAAIFVTSMCFNLISDGLRTAMDVRIKL